MLNNLFENELYHGLYQTSILLIMVSLLSFITYFILTLAFNVSTQRNKLKMRVVYVACVLTVFFLAKIWVQGFTQIFYGLSLVSAGLVITNKETIMNLVGWGIISWRGLFSEGDYIEISGFNGVIYELGILYFKLLESSPSMPARSTGKVIKVPNGTVIHNAVKRVSLDRYFLEQNIQCLVPADTNIVLLKENILAAVKSILESSPEAAKYPQRVKKDASLIKSLVYQPPHINTQFYFDKPEYLKLTISYHCKAISAEMIDGQIKDKILTFLHPLPLE